MLDAWWDKLRPPQADEVNMLEFANDPAPHSRLGCQIKVRAEMDGMIVRVPAQCQPNDSSVIAE